ncbi:hypothetical protein [Krasilnikovia sp. M28-CT-15]|uniref:hypothetical protein n=1 Tax=Krasilnikovia sp. M28-CT-15 TaxID=3373540 RepID=UPI00387632B3
MAELSGLVVTFRDADEPRPLAARFVGTALWDGQGWRLAVSGEDLAEYRTFDAAAAAVRQATGIRRLLIVWFAAEGE